MPARGSRFFPHIGETAVSQSRRSMTYSHSGVLRSPSPPPAEEPGQGHPAFDGDMGHPIVQLPPEKPVVKLPPPPQAAPVAQPTTTSQPRSFAAALAAQPLPPQSSPLPKPQSSLRNISTPIASTSSWQDRFNGLLGKKPTPEKKPQVLAVASSTREPLDVTPMNVLASVSLPQTELEEHYPQDAGKTTSRDVEDEEEIFEDREPGSQPMVKIPLVTPKAAWRPARTSFNRANHHKGKWWKPEEMAVTASFTIEDLEAPGRKNDSIIVRLSNDAKPIIRSLPRKESSSSSTPRSKGSRSSSYNPKPKKGAPKSRDTASSVPQPIQQNKGAPAQHQLPNGTTPSPKPPHHSSHRWQGNRQTAGVAH